MDRLAISKDFKDELLPLIQMIDGYCMCLDDIYMVKREVEPKNHNTASISYQIEYQIEYHTYEIAYGRRVVNIEYDRVSGVFDVVYKMISNYIQASRRDKLIQEVLS